VLAFDGVVLADLAGPCELLRRAGYDVRVCSERRRVDAGHGVTLSTPHRLTALRRAHTIIVPGLAEDGPAPSPTLIAELRRAIRRGARVASICSGAFVLALTGALDGLSATTHWRGAAELQRRHPRVRVDPDVLYVDNGQLLTSAGAAAGLDLCLHLVRKDLGAAVAAQAARDAVMPLERSGGQAQFIVHAPPPAAAEGSLTDLLQWLERHAAEEHSLATLAKRAALSTRTFSRRFREQVGTTPAQWLIRARVRRAQQLLESTALPIERVAEAAGFRSATVLREHFHRQIGTAPTGYRRAFSAASPASAGRRRRPPTAPRS